MTISLSYFKFKKTLEQEIRNYWSICSHGEISKLWLEEKDKEKTLTKLISKTAPFSYVNVSNTLFVENFPYVVEFSRENAVVNFITAFEVYLSEILARIIYIEPQVMSDSELKFEASDIVKGLESANVKKWFSEKITDKNIRNKQHSEIIEKIAKFGKCDLKSIKSEIDEWNKWTYVRNSIVHTGRRVSHDLKNTWPEKYPIAAAKLSITNKELAHVQSLAQKIASHLDKRCNETIIKTHDAALLIRELFIRNGIEDVGELKTILDKNLNYRTNDNEIIQVLVSQRRSSTIITEIDFDAFFPDIKL